MSFAKSFYADQKKIEPKQEMSPASMPATTPIAEDPLSAAQIQEAIRLYRSVLSSSQSAPSSPRRGHQEEMEERREVHSNYYGGGPTDIPQSYLLNFSPSVAPAPAPAPAQAAQAPPTFKEAPKFSEQQLIAQLENLQVKQKEEKTVPKKAPLLQKMYDDEESGYCFNRKNQHEEAELQEEATPTIPCVVPQEETVHYSQPVMVPVQKAYVPSGPSEYIGMSNDNRFIYDAQKALPVSYTQNNTYTLVNSSPAPAPPIPKLNLDTDVGMTTEDITQVPESPAITSRFRGMIRNAQTPVTAPIVVERVAEASPTGYHFNNYNQQNNNYGAFMPVNHNSMESEYQLPVLNDLASCIEHY